MSESINLCENNGENINNNKPVNYEVWNNFLIPWSKMPSYVITAL